MTEAEALELIAIYVTNAHGGFALYLSVTFAYLVTAYLVGSKLSPFQALAVSGLFFISATIIALSTMASVQAWIAVKRSTSTVIDTVALYNPELWLFTLPVILFPGVLVSLYFMWHIRHEKTE